MSRIGSLILLLSLSGLLGCGYSFVLGNTTGANHVCLMPTRNETKLIGASMTMDASLENALASMGMLSTQSTAEDIPSIRCIIQSVTTQGITSSSKSASDRYRLVVQVRAELINKDGDVIWKSTFKGDGTYMAVGQEEDAIEAACKEISQDISRTIACLTF